MTRRQGRVAQWNDERGFGFITPDAGGPRLFAHVSAFPRGQRPAGNDLVTFAAHTDERGRPAAADIRYVGRRVPRTDTSGLTQAVVVTAGFFTLLVVLVVVGQAPALLLMAYGPLSVITFVMYRADKLAAVRRGWRTPEANLHAVALLGGWPGALVARRAYRHKTTKQPFRTIFWLTAVANCAALGWLLLAQPTWLPGLPR